MSNRDEYQTHMNQGYAAAWEGQWTRAVQEFTRALQLMADDPEATTQLGLALLNSEQLDNAYKVLKRASQLLPDDPVPLEGAAEALEQLGRMQEAASQYVAVADLYLSQKDLEKAVGNWRRATRLTPGLVSVHARLAQAYERMGDKKRAIREYLTLAFNFKRLNDVDKAIKAVDKALRLDKKNPQALNAKRALETGSDMPAPRVEADDDDAVSGSRVAPSGASMFDLDMIDGKPDVGESDPMGPIGEAMSDALTLLAQFVVESGLNSYGGDALQAMEFHRQSIYEQAVEAYKRAEPGLRHPSLKLCLGGLLLITDKPDEAVKHLGEAAMDPVLAAGALHAMGQSYYKLGQHRKAAQLLVRSLRTVDTSLAENPHEIEDLNSVYDSLLVELEGCSEESLVSINERFLGLLTGKDWKRRIPVTRRHLAETIRSEGKKAVIPFLVEEEGEEIAKSVTLIDQYIGDGLYTLAMDEAHQAVQKSPFYLPVHVRMAEIMIKEGRLRQAINKYNVVARAHLVRDEKDRAAAILSEVLERAPLDIEVRTSLIELLESENRMDEALDQYVDLGNTYQQLGDFDHARTTYEEAERLARRISASNDKVINVKHRIADIAQIRLNTRQAAKIYEDILELDGNDEKSLRMLVDIYFGQGNHVEAIKRLDGLLGLYAKQGQINKIAQLLEEQVRLYPEQTSLRSRLASIYKRMGRKQEAIEQLDALGELQLDAGLHKDAAGTIRQIIEMQPDRIEEYKRLLSQLGG